MITKHDFILRGSCFYEMYILALIYTAARSASVLRTLLDTKSSFFENFLPFLTKTSTTYVTFYGMSQDFNVHIILNVHFNPDRTKG